MNQIQIHFDGDITTNHRVSMRTLGKTLSHLQNAMDRAYIENKYGEVWKHARMKVADYEESAFLVEEPSEGGYVLDFFADNVITKAIADRVALALSPAVERAMHQGEENSLSIQEELETRISQIHYGSVDPIDFQELVDNPSKKIKRKYGDRAITREIDQILSIIRSRYSGESTFELSTYGSKPHRFVFDKELSKKFHDVVSKRSLGEPVIYKAKVSRLDYKNNTGKITNLSNDKEANIIFANNEGFLLAKDFLGTNQTMEFIGCPMIEYGAFDPQAGDIYFLGLV